MTLMFLNGGGMSDGPLNHLLGGARFEGPVRTAARYRFYSFGDRFPGIAEVAEGGTEVAGELYDVPLEVLRESLLPNEPEELELGIIELSDGRPSLSMVVRRDRLQQSDIKDITDFADWRAYRAQR